MTKPPDGFTLRHSTAEDADAAQALIDEVESVEMGEPRRGTLDIVTECRDARMDLKSNTWIVRAPGGEAAAFGYVFWGDSAQGEGEPFVSPRYRGLGLGDALLEVIEARAADLAAGAAPETRPRLHVWCGEDKVRRRGWLLGHGYRAVRETYLMRLDLGDGPPQPSALPAGIDLRLFVVGRDEAALHAADEEAFADHFLHEPSTLDEWRVHSVERSDFDPSLWIVAWAGDEVAGETLTFVDENEALVDSLSVSRQWRGRGLGLALLTRAFGLAHERGRRKVRLGVDAQNTTGALALYLKAGMRIERREEVYAKDLR